MTASIWPFSSAEKASVMVSKVLTSPVIFPCCFELFRLQFPGGAELHPDGTVADVVYRLDGGAALDHERLVGVEVRVGEVDLLLACLGYGERRVTRVVEVVAKAGDDPVEGDVLELGVKPARLPISLIRSMSKPTGFPFFSNSKGGYAMSEATVICSAHLRHHPRRPGRRLHRRSPSGRVRSRGRALPRCSRTI